MKVYIHKETNKIKSIINLDDNIYAEAFGPTAVFSFYRDFIYGAFSESPAFFVILIGSGQILSGSFLLMSKKYYQFGIIGGTVFLTAIMPLGLGSAFPSTLLMAVSLVFLWKKSGNDRLIYNGLRTE